METIERAIIIAAGQGTRLRPVTNNIPKPLVPVNGTRIVDTSIKALRENGISDIYLIVGYKKELFYNIYKNQPDIHIIENLRYAEGNNILSLYMARQYLPGAFVVEGDILVGNADVFAPSVESSFYCGERMPVVEDWAFKMEDGRLVLKSKGEPVKEAYRMWGVSAWTMADGMRLAELIRKHVEEHRSLSIYWDEVALLEEKEQFSLQVREIQPEDLKEVDTVQELAELDSSYREFVHIHA